MKIRWKTGHVIITMMVDDDEKEDMEGEAKCV